MNMKIIIKVQVFLIMLLVGSSKTEANINDELNLFIVNYVLIAHHIEFSPFYFEPNFIRNISEKSIESIVIERDDWKQYGFNFKRDGKIESIFKYGTVLKEFKYTKINDTLFVNDRFKKGNYKFHFVADRIMSFEYIKLNPNNGILEQSYKIEYNEKNFTMDFFNKLYYFDYERKLLSYGKINKNILSFLFCGSNFDVFRNLQYNQDTIINTVYESNLNKYYSGLFPPPYEFNYKGILNTQENSFDVYNESKLWYKFISNNKGLVSKALEYYNNGNVEKYSFFYTFYE